jgi:serine O-acetyltransferase
MLKKYILEPQYRVLKLYRLSGVLANKNRFSRLISLLILNHLKVKYAIEFNNVNPIGVGLKIFHFNGVVIGHGCIIGDDLTLYNNVTIGGKRIGGIIKYPVIGNNVTIYPGARVIGDITIGDGCIIGPNSVVYKSLNKNSVVLNKSMEIIER